MESKNNFFKIPFGVKQDKENVKVNNNLHIVGIIDASGSMASWWKWVADFYNQAIPQDSLKTFTFDHRVQECYDNHLTERIQNHGGGRTAIPEVFAAFEKHLETIPKEKDITVLFISDGQDNSLHTLQKRMENLKGNKEERKINFVCLGIKSGFPTFLSMQLRKLYHRGDESIPALFLVEYVSEKAFFNKFEGIKKYFYSSGAVSVEPAIQFFPWDESVTDQAYEGSWVITKADTVKVNGVEYKVQKGDLNVEQLVEVFRGWVQQIQLASLTDMKEASSIARIALDEMKRHIEIANKQIGFNVLMKLDEQNNQVGDDFAMRTKKNYIIRYGGRLLWFLEEIEQISKGILPKADNEFEAAKRMNLGTITGKYQQKVLALKNIPANKFMQFVKEFKEKLKDTKLESPQGEVSCVKKILLQKDFASALEYITNQFDFVEMFELTGNGFKLKRSDQTETNPYQAEGKGVSKKILDWPTIIQKDFRVSVKGRDQILFSASEITALEEGFVDEINCVIPFFSKENDSDISQLLNTNLMHLTFTYLITQNADVMMEDSYLILIGHFLTTIFNQFNQQQNQDKQNFLQKAYESLHVYYKFNQGFQQKALLLNKNPQIYFKNYGDDHILKTLTMVFYLVQGGQIDKQQKDKLFEIFNLYFFKKFVQIFDNDINKILKPEITEKEKDIMRQYFNQNINSYYSISAFRKGFSIKLEELLQKSTSDAVIPKKDLYNNDKNDLSLQTLESFGKLMLEKQYKFTDYSMMAKHVCENPQKYLETEVNWDLKDLNKVVLSQINQNNIKFMPGYSVFFEEIETLYTQNFQENHWGIRPIPKEQIQKICKEKGINFDELKFSISGLLENACCAQKCGFFLQPMNDLDKHLAGWQGKIPRGFHRFVNSRLEFSPKQLMQQAKQKWGKAFPNKYGVDEKYVTKYFQETLEAYQINKYGEIKYKINDEQELQREKEYNESITGIVKKRWLKKIEKQGINPFYSNELKKQYKAIISEEPQQQQIKQENQQQQQQKQKEPWNCQSCTVENPGENDICFVCQWNPKKPDEWHCSECTFLNSPKSQKCAMCQQGVKPVRKEVVIEKPKEEQKQQEQKKEENQKQEKSKFEENQEQIPENLRKKWNNEQKYLKNLLCETDEHLEFQVIPKPLENNQKNVEFQNLKYIAGVDISFSQEVENLACSYLSILSFPSLEIVYEDFEYIKLDQPYVSGFLAFREAAHILKLFEKLFKAKPELTPQVVMVDGNGILHQNGCGLASHLGILLDLPTIGVGKTTFYADGLTKDIVLQNFQEIAKQKGDFSYLKGQSGRIWGAALKSEENVKNPIYISIGTNISLDTACQLVQQCSKFRIPEPVRIADLNSREKIRNLKNPEEQKLVQDNKLPFLTEFIEDEFPDNPEAEDNKNLGQIGNQTRAQRRQQHKQNHKGGQRGGKKGGYRGKKK